MQFQRQQFWLYSILVNRLRKPLAVLLLFIIALMMQTTYLWLEHNFTRDYSHLSKCLDSYMDIYKPKEGEFLGKQYLLRVEVGNFTQCSIRENEPHGKNIALYIFEDSALEHLQPTNIKEKHKIIHIYIALSVDKLAKERTISHFGTEAILMDALQREMAKRNISNINMRDYSQLHSNTHIKSHGQRNLFVVIFFKLLYLLLAFISLSVCLWANLVINCLLILLNAGLVPILLLFKRFNILNQLTQQHYLLHGHLAAFQNRHKSIQFLMMVAYFATFLIIFMGLSYFFEYVVYGFVNLYVQSQRKYYVYTLYLVQLLNIIVCRTRISIAYTPRILLLVLFITSYLLLTDAFNLPQYYLSMCLYSCLIHFLILIIYVEGSVARLSDQCIHKPTYDRPRTYYFPVFNVRWHDGLPPLWTVLVPSYPRQSFSLRQLSYVDKNYEVMYAQISGLAAGDEDASLDVDQPDGLFMA